MILGLWLYSRTSRMMGAGRHRHSSLQKKGYALWENDHALLTIPNHRLASAGVSIRLPAGVPI
jgi:hypothetical protein